MKTIKLTIAYDGTNYNGWQVQKNGPSVQGEIEKAVKKIFKCSCRVHGAGRTDAGVHAKKQVAHFKLANDIRPSKIKNALNAVLPDDISILRSELVKDGFHSQYDAKSKHYRYHIYNSRKHDPFKTRYFWRVAYDLDVGSMSSEAKILKGKHDFSSFQAKANKEKNSIRCISMIDIKKKGSTIILDVKGDGFLYNMVRNIAGTLVDIGRGYLPKGSLKKILSARKRSEAGPTAPPQGLFLMEVKY